MPISSDPSLPGSSLRCAIYARYSSALQHPTSIDDQIRECRNAAVDKGWIVLDEHIYSDEETPGQSMLGRTGLAALLQHADAKQRYFDVILSDDTSRFGRNLSVTLPQSDLLEYRGVILYFVHQELQSTDPHFRDLFIQSGRQDEQFSKALGQKVKRGQTGRVERGYIGSGRTYGYDNVPVEILGSRGLYGRPKVEGVKLEINQDQAAVVRRIFEMRAAGISCLQIVRTLNRESVPSSLHKSKKKRRVWQVTTVVRLLSNQKYRGVYLWNQRRQIRNPISGRKELVPRPQTEWQRDERPELRIVSDELWEAAQKNLHCASNHLIGTRRGGLNRTEASRRYIFSGCLKCAGCGGRINIVGGQPPWARYGCHQHRFLGTCTNGLTISQRTLEEQLLEHLADGLRDLRLADELSSQFHAQLQLANKKEAELANEMTGSGSDLHAKKSQLQAQLKNVLDTATDFGPSPELKSRYKTLETQLAAIEQKITVRTEPMDFTAEQIREFLDRKLADIAAVLASDPELAKREIQNRVKELTLTPVETDQGPAYEISGDLRLLASDQDVMQIPCSRNMS